MAVLGLAVDRAFNDALRFLLLGLSLLSLRGKEMTAIHSLA